MKGNFQERNGALKRIYEVNKQRIVPYVLANNGSLEEAQDVFQESMITLYENVRDDKFKGESAINTYLYSIAKFKWLNQIKKNTIRTIHHENLEKQKFSESPLVKIVEGEYKEQVQNVLSQLGESCKNILIDSLYHNASMKEIAQQHDFSSEQVVRNKKHKCLQRLKELIQQNPSLIEVLKGNG